MQCQDYPVSKEQQMMLEQLDSHMQKNEVRLLAFAIHKNQQRWIKDFNARLKP